MNKVLVLMSTYNGELYIEEQIRSIMSQKNVSIDLLIRDDGSLDSTKNIIINLQKQYSNIFFYEGNNLGFTYSFYDLINHAKGYEYYAFSDQDDIWEEDKLHRAVSKMTDKYIMYASNMTLVDEKLNFINNLYNDFNYEKNLLITCFPFYNPFGCTIVWKNSLQEKIKDNLPDIKIPHDLWLHIVASFNGKVYIDETPSILHRLHGDNACGIGRNIITRLKKLKKFYLSEYRITTDTSLKIAVKKYGYDNFTIEEKNFLDQILSYKNNLLTKIILFNSTNFKKIKWKKRLEFLFLILINKF